MPNTFPQRRIGKKAALPPRIPAVVRMRTLGLLLSVALLACGSTPGENNSQNSAPAATASVAPATAAPATAAPADAGSTASPVPSGVDVAFVQTLLDVAGFGPLAYDGVFGPRSAAATTEFQRSVPLPETGVVDDQTWVQLLIATSEDTLVTTCEETTSRPTTFTFCGDATEYQDFTWDPWTPQGGVGRGVLVATCAGLCDNGEATVETEIEMELTDPQPIQCGDAPPWLEFTTVTVNDPGIPPYSFSLGDPLC